MTGAAATRGAPVAGRRVYWVDLNRFDVKPDKSTWLETSEALIRRGFDVTILTGYKRTRYRPGSHRVQMQYFSSTNLAGAFRYVLLAKVVAWLIRHSREGDVIILHPVSLYAAPLLRLFGRRNLHLDVRTLPVEIHSFRDKIDRFLFWTFPMRFLRRFVRGYSFITTRLRAAVEAEFRTEFPASAIWESGVDTDRFAAAGAGTRAMSSGDYTLFYHGTLTANRGLERVIQGIAALEPEIRRKVRLVIVGDGSAREPLEKLAVSAGIADRISFKGLVPYEDVPREIGAADCCICPLPDRAEWNVSSPIKVFEYMACGKPMILTPIPAHRDVAGGCPFVVWTDGESAAAFAAAIRNAVERRHVIANAAAAGEALVRSRYDWDLQGAKLAEYLAAHLHA